MKKAIAIISLIIAFFVIYFLQTNFFTWFTIGGIMPNLFIILVLFIGLFIGKKVGFILGIVFGIILDFLLGQAVGGVADVGDLTVGLSNWAYCRIFRQKLFER